MRKLAAKHDPRCPSFEALAQDALECALAWRGYAERPATSSMQSMHAVKLSALFVHQKVILTLMAETEKSEASHAQ